jgi:signal transduction histidine kinase
MLASASDRRPVHLRPRELPDALPAAAALVAFGLLLVAGGGPLRPALATFALATAGVLAALWLRGAVAGNRARRRAEAVHAAVVAEAVGRLRADLQDHRAGDLAAALEALVGGAAAPGSVAAVARAAAAATRSEARDVPVIVSVAEDMTVAAPGLDQALGGLLRRAVAAAPAGSTVTVAVGGGRVEVRDEGAPGGADPFAVDLARALARRAGGDLHVFARADGPGTLAVLELPPTRAAGTAWRAT